MAGSSNLTPEEVARNLLSISDETLASLSHDTLYRAREHAAKADQNRLAKYEHRAFAREVIPERPTMALSLPFAIPAYQAYKAVAGKSRSQGSVDQTLQAFIGVGEGIEALLASMK